MFHILRLYSDNGAQKKNQASSYTDLATTDSKPYWGFGMLIWYWVAID